MLTAKSAEEGRIRGLELGADDYVAKGGPADHPPGHPADRGDLTVSPVLADRADTPAPGWSPLELLPGRTKQVELLSLRHHGSYLFLRTECAASPHRGESDDAW